MPKMTKHFDNIKGLTANKCNIRDSLINIMVTLTELMDNMTTHISIEPFMNCENRNNMFSTKTTKE